MASAPLWQSMTFDTNGEFSRADVAGLHPVPPQSVEAEIQAAAGRGRCALPRVRAGGANFPTRRSANTRRATRRRKSCSRCAIFSASTRTSSSRRRATPRTTAPWSMRSMPSNGRAKGVAFVGEEVTDDELKWMDKAGVRGVRFNFLKRLVDFTPRDVLARIAARVAKARLAHRGLFRNARSAGARGFLHLAADHRRGRSHGHARREEGRRSSGEPALSSRSWTSTRIFG